MPPWLSGRALDTMYPLNLGTELPYQKGRGPEFNSRRGLILLKKLILYIDEGLKTT